MLHAAASQYNPYHSSYNPYHNPLDLAKTYLGPEVDLSDRIRAIDAEYSKNLVPAHVPLQYIYKGDGAYRSKPVEMLMRHPVTYLNDLYDEAHREVIRNKFRHNIEIFFSQACLLYKTGIQCLFHDAADAQIGGPSVSNDSVPFWERVKNRQFHAAHIASLPTLRVTMNRQDRGIAFGRGSFFHMSANATMWLPAVVNEVDKNLDSETFTGVENQSFRYHATTYLNSVSHGWYNPKVALQWYLYKALCHLDLILNKQHITPEKRIVAEDYKSVAEFYYTELNRSDYIINALSCEFGYYGEQLFESVQYRMHKLFKSEMYKLMPVRYDTSHLEARLRTPWNPSRFTNYLNYSSQVRLENQILEESDTIEKYLAVALLTRNVRIAGLHYLTQIPNEWQLYTDLDKITKPKKAIEKQGLSEAVMWLYRETLGSIYSASGVRHPQNMKTIMVRVLVGLSNDPRIDT